LITHNTKRIGVLEVALILVTTWSCGQPREERAAGGEETATGTLAEAARASRETWFVLADEPAVHLWWARDFHQRGNAGSAAGELSKSATMLRWGASHVATPEERLADYHVKTALREWEEGEQHFAAKLLDAAATEIEQRFAVVGSPPVTRLDEAVAEARFVAQKLGTPEAPTEHEVRRAIENLERVLDQLVEVSQTR
jgi:hypothetical protein